MTAAGSNYPTFALSDKAALCVRACVSQSVEIYCFVFFFYYWKLHQSWKQTRFLIQNRNWQQALFFPCPFCQICLTNHRKRLQCCLVGLTLALKNSSTFYHDRVPLPKTYQRRFRDSFALFFFILQPFTHWMRPQQELATEKKQICDKVLTEQRRRVSLPRGGVETTDLSGRMSEGHFLQVRLICRTTLRCCCRCRCDVSSARPSGLVDVLVHSVRVRKNGPQSEKINNNGRFVAAWRPRPIGSSEIGNVKKSF